MKSISASELQQKLQENNPIFLLDVREEVEHNQSNIGGLLIPLGEINNRIKDIPKNEEVIVYCRVGIRSQIAIQRLEQKGFTNLINLTGGIEAFQKL